MRLQEKQSSCNLIATHCLTFSQIDILTDPSSSAAIAIVHGHHEGPCRGQSRRHQRRALSRQVRQLLCQEFVSEKVYCYQRQETWLRLKSGKGWVSTVGHDGHTLLIQQAAASPYRPKNGANVCSNSSNSIDSSVEHSHRMVRQILKIGPHHHAGH